MSKFTLVLFLLIITTLACSLTSTSTPSDSTSAATEGSSVVQPTQLSSSAQLIKVYLIAPEDGGATGVAVGCSDSAIPVRRKVSTTGDTVTDTRMAVVELLSIGVREYGQ